MLHSFPTRRSSDLAATWLLHPDAPKVEPPAAIKKRSEEYDRLMKAGQISNPVEGSLN